MKKIYIILAIIVLLIFSIFYYKKSKLGNTIIKLSEENIENILSENLKYEAKAKVKIYSNKNENEYSLKIKEEKDYSLLETIGKSDISGLKIEKKNGDLIIKNGELKLTKIYEDYNEFTDNSLLLTTFLEEYKESKVKEVVKENGKMVVKIEVKDYNKYIKYKELYLNESDGKPEKLVIKDSSKQVKIIIEYTNIEIL